MFEPELISQLTQVFGAMTQTINLVMAPSKHEKSAELREWLESLSRSSPYIKLSEGGAESPWPFFYLEIEGRHSGIEFLGIPGGHEFSSLILAILNSAGLGKSPDEGTRQRIKRLKGPATLTSYVSLSCENCPDVVQALNQIALIHGHIVHCTVDGDYVSGELLSKGIQSVPTVQLDGQTIHSGKATILDLIEKLESTLGSVNLDPSAAFLGHYKVAVLGGGPAGVGAAIYAVRKGQSTALVCERMGGQLKDTQGIENFIGTIYTEGPKLGAELEQHLRSYPVQVWEHRRADRVEIQAPKIMVYLSSGESLSCEALVVATGAKWRELQVPGEKEFLGRGVAYCPHCEGPFFKGRDVAVVGGGNSGMEAAIDLAGLCSSVSLLEYGSTFKADHVLVEKAKAAKNITLIKMAQTTEIFGDSQGVRGLRYKDRESEQMKELAVAAVFVQIGLIPNSAVVKGLVETNAYGEIVIDAKCRTSLKQIYAAGDVTTVPHKQIAIAMGEGSKAALSAFEDQMRGSS